MAGRFSDCRFLGESMGVIKKQALVVDDGEMNRNLLRTFLSITGFDVETAEDGVIGLEKSKLETYDLVFSDIEMPNMNGLEFLRNLKQQSPYKGTPVIVLSTVNKTEILERAKKLGAVHYMVKPF